MYIFRLVNTPKLISLILFTQCCTVTTAASGQDVDLSSQELSSHDPPNRFFGKLGVLGATYRPAARVSNASGTIPNADVSLPLNVTVTVDLVFTATKHFDLDLMAGVPVNATLTASGSLAPLGALGRALYGPVIATVQCHTRTWRRTQPYVGVGAAYAVVLNAHDGAVKDFQVHDNWGSVLQEGVNYTVTRRVGVFADFKEVWLSLNADGNIGIPARAHVRLNPALISAGFKYRF